MNVKPARTLYRREQLLALLADGELHSGEWLAAQLLVTRAAVWKLIHGLSELGIVIEAQHQGYRLPHAIDLYDSERLQQLCGAQASCLQQVDCLFEVDSTNSYLSRYPVRYPGHAIICVAEVQHAGRGRRGRSWVAPFGESICMSLGWMFETMPPNISSLSLMVGVALTRVLRAMGAQEVGVKWPNDLLWQGRKLAGVLIEMRGEPDGQAQIVIGVGINYRFSEKTREGLAAQQLAVCDLHEILGLRVPARNQLVASIACELIQCLNEFSRTGFVSFKSEWLNYDVLHQQSVQVLQGNRRLIGVAQGVTAEGSLLLRTEEGMQAFHSGEVSLRAGHG
jgi:BirA family biotin operon repressor/biotin-[acetyl-CoA-carboxylase] ligase